jgi:hypothetical protein
MTDSPLKDLRKPENLYSIFGEAHATEILEKPTMLDDLLLACLLPRLKENPDLLEWMEASTNNLTTPFEDSPFEHMTEMNGDLFEEIACFVYFHCSPDLSSKIKKLQDDIEAELWGNPMLKPSTKKELNIILRALSEHEGPLFIAWYIGQVQAKSVDERRMQHEKNVGSGTAIFGWLAKWMVENGFKLQSRIVLNDVQVAQIGVDFDLQKQTVMRVAEPVWIQACRAFRELNPLYGTNIAAMVSRWGHARDGMPPGMIANDEDVIVEAQMLVAKNALKYTLDYVEWKALKEAGNPKIWAICAAKAQLAYLDPDVTFVDKKAHGDCHPRAKYHPGVGDEQVVSEYGGLWRLFLDKNWSSFCLVYKCLNAVKIDYPQERYKNMKGRKGKSIGKIWPRCQNCIAQNKPLPESLKAKFPFHTTTQGHVSRNFALVAEPWEVKFNNTVPPTTITTPANERGPPAL